MPCLHHPGVVDDLIVCWRCRRQFCRNCVVELQSFYFCPECKPLQVRDILAGTDMVNPDYASNGRRALAWLIDGLVKFAFEFAAGMIGNVIGLIAARANATEAGLAGQILCFFLGQACSIVYEAVMLTRNKGQTLGKMAVGIRVVTPEGNPISAGQAWWRSSFKVILNMAMCTCGCMAWLLDGAFVFGVERATMHDLVAQTRVVNVD